MTSINEVIDAVGDALKAHDIHVTSYLPDTAVPPVAMIGVGDVRYHGTFRTGSVEADLVVMLIVARVDAETSRQKLHDFMDATGDKSFRQVLEDDRTFGGVVSTSVCRSSGQIAPVEIGGVLHLAAEWDLTVYYSGS